MAFATIATRRLRRVTAALNELFALARANGAMTPSSKLSMPEPCHHGAEWLLFEFCTD
jgi:hypothetical protein